MKFNSFPQRNYKIFYSVLKHLYSIRTITTPRALHHISSKSDACTHPAISEFKRTLYHSVLPSSPFSRSRISTFVPLSSGIPVVLDVVNGSASNETLKPVTTPSLCVEHAFADANENATKTMHNPRLIIEPKKPIFRINTSSRKIYIARQQISSTKHIAPHTAHVLEVWLCVI